MMEYTEAARLAMKTDMHDLLAAPSLYPTYARLTRGTPFCYDVSCEEFVDGATYTGPWPRAQLTDERVITAVEGGNVVGFAQVGVASSQGDDDDDRGVIRFFIYPPGRRDVGGAVLRGVDAYLREQDLRRAEAFIHGYSYRPYHLGFGALSATLGHVHGLLGSHGYRVADTERFLLWDGYDETLPPRPTAGAEVTTKTSDGGGQLPDFALTATYAGESVGECLTHSVGRYSRASEAQRTLFTAWLGVSDGWQGKGWGRYLLMRSLSVGRQLGYQSAVISADARNYRALLLYTNAGYKVANCGYSFRKDA
jgi:ribosomal protein S18 acetylase RimI-like enzyme